jgi:hypothetical protein
MANTSQLWLSIVILGLTYICQSTLAAPKTVVQNLSHPVQIARDTLDNLYIVDQGCVDALAPNGDCNVYKETPNGAGSYTQTLLSNWTSSSVPVGVAVDTSGNVYISVYGSGVYEQKLLSPTPTSGYGPPTLVIHCLTLGQIAGDNHANLVVVDTGQGVVFKEPTGQPFVDCGPTLYGNNGAIVASGLSKPRFVATDASGDVFVDTNSAQLLKETPSGSGYNQSVVTTLSGIASITGIGMSFAQTGGSRLGYVYVAAGNLSTVYAEIPSGPPSSVSYSQQTLCNAYLLFPQGVAVDGGNNVFVVDTASNSVLEIPYQPAPPPPTGLGATVR